MAYTFESTDKDCFSLHDCWVSSAELKNGKFTLFFPDGIFYTGYGDNWPNTGKAAIEYDVAPLYGVSFFLFIKADGQVIRKEYTAEQLVEKLNGNEWELEFAYRYDGFEMVLHTCWVWMGDDRRSYEGQLSIDSSRELFRWNPPDQVEKTD